MQSLLWIPRRFPTLGSLLSSRQQPALLTARMNRTPRSSSYTFCASVSYHKQKEYCYGEGFVRVLPPDTLSDESCSVAQQWIVSMVSVPTKPSLSLKTFGFIGITLGPRHWESIVLATDVSALENLDFQRSGFLQEQLELLVDHIADSRSESLPLRSVKLDSAAGFNSADLTAAKAKLGLLAPNATIYYCTT